MERVQYQITFMEAGDDYEQYEYYDNHDDAETMFNYMVETTPDDYKYVILDVIELDDEGYIEERQNIKDWNYERK